MKQIKLIIAFLFVLTGSAIAQENNYLTFPDFSVKQGAQYTLNIEMKNANTIKYGEFKLKLPAGLKVAKKANPFYDSEDPTSEPLIYDVSLVRVNGHDIACNEISTDLYGFVISSMNKSVPGNSGTFVTVNLVADADAAPGTHDVLLKDVILANSSTLGYEPANKTMKVTIIPTHVNVAFNTQGGGTIDPVKIVYETAVTKPTDPTRTGYTFGGWYKEAACTTEWVFADKVMTDMTLYAKWTINTYAIGATATAGGSVTGGATYEYGKSVSLVATPATGYDFVNWTEGGTEVSKDLTYTFTADKARTLVANFKIQSFAIAATAGTGGSVTGAATYEYGQSVSLVATVATGYDFVNWTEGGTEVSKDLTYTFTADKARTLVANFKIQSYAIAATASPVGGGSLTGAATYEYGKSVSLVATAATGYDFVNWTVNGSEVSKVNPYKFKATGVQALVANFKIQSYAIAATAGTGGSVTGAATYEYGQSVSLVATPATGYDFVNWTEGGTEVSKDLTYTFTADKARTLVANFKIQSYAITTTATPADKGSVTGSGTFDYNSDVTLTATPATGYDFVNWTVNGSEVSKVNPYKFKATGVQALVANFKIQSYAIAATATTGGSLTGGATYEYGQSVSLVATAATGYDFVNWTEGGVEVSKELTYTFTADKARTLVANFKIQSYAIAATASPVGGGSLTGAATYEYGKSVSLVATAATGYDFVNWTEGGVEVSKDLTYTFTADKVRTLVANFKIQSYAITTTATPGDKGSVTGSGTFDYNSDVTLTATPVTGYDFVNWTVNGSEVSKVNPYKFKATGVQALVANFKIQSYAIAATAGTGGSVTGAATYEYGQSVSLVATASTGYDFVNWTEGGVEVSKELTYTFTADKARTLVANFKIQSYAITTTATPADKGSVTGAGTFDYNTDVTLTATPVTGYAFVNWTVNAAEVSKVNPYVFKATGVQALVANFKIQSYAIAATATTGGSLTGAATYEYGQSVSLVATAATGYDFVNWTEGGVEVSKDLTYTFTADKARTLVANFKIQSYAIAATATTGGSLTGAATYEYGKSVSLVATAATGYDFVNWTEGGVEVSKDLTYTFTADKVRTLVANFKIQSYAITTTATPGDKGSVTGSGTFDYNSDVTLTATPVTGYDFVNWTVNGSEVSKVNPYKFKATGVQALVANFKIQSYAIAATAGTGGSVTGAATYEYGQSVSLVATVATGYDFVNWTEGGTEVSKDLTYTFPADKARTLVANFKIQSYAITTTATPADKGSVTGGGTFDYNSDVTLTATPATGYDFVNWTVGATEVSKVNPYKFKATGVQALVANFKIQSYAIAATATTGGSVTGGATYEYGQSVSLVATAATGYDFVNWTEGGVEVSKELTYTFTADKARTLVANFKIQSYAIAATATTGGSLTGGATYEYGKSVSLVATAATGYDFVNWTEGGVEVSKELTYTFTADKARTLVANFKIQNYAITVSALPAEKGSVTGGGSFDYNTDVTLTATPVTGYKFVNWTVDGNEVTKENPYSYKATKAQTLVANFEIETYAIGATATTGGSVTGAATYEYGKSVSLVATPATGYDFVNWTEGGTEISKDLTYTFTADKARTLVANFKIQSYAITTTAVPADKGSVTGGGTFDYNSDVTLTATPVTGYKFVNWMVDGSEVSKENPYSFKASKVQTLVANFEIQSFEIGASSSIPAGGTVTGGATYEYGQSVSLVAAASTGYDFLNWTEDGVEVSKDLTYTFTADKARALVANFKIQSFAIAATAGIGGSVTGAATYEYGQSVSLVATPATGYDFLNWTEDGVEVSKDLTYTFTADKARTLVANFKIQSYDVAVEIISEGFGTVTGAGTYEYGSTATLVATPAEGYVFDKWIINGTESTNPTLEFTVSGTVSVQAQFSLYSGVDGTEESTIAVFPTLVKDEFTIAHAEAFKMNIYDNDGRLILSKIVTDAAYVISASDWTSGIYHILLTNGKRVVKEQIVKE